MTKAALITGGAKRIGKVISLTLAKQGYDIALHYNRSIDEANALAAQIRQDYNVHVVLLRAELKQEKDVTSLINQACEQLDKPLNLLVNNASCFLRDDWQNSPKHIWDENLAVNLRAPFLLMQDFAKQVQSHKLKNSGLIVNMLDSKVNNLHPAFMSYTAAKSALYTLTQTMAQALAPHIRVNAIGPGPVLPSSFDTEESWAKAAEKTALKRTTAPEEIAQTILWMLSSPSLTGQMIMLDNGEHLGWKIP